MLSRLVGAGLVAVLLVWAGTAALYAHDSGLGIVRYNSDGRLDAQFGHGGIVAERTVQGGLSPEALAIEPDGKIVLVGTTSDLATAAVGFGLARYGASGTLDPGFGGGGRVLTRVGAASAEAHAVAVQPDGDLVVAGSGFAADAAAVSDFAVARYTPDGALDPRFGSGGLVLTPLSASGAEARAIALQSDGRIVVAGTAFASGTTSDALALVRYNVDGSLDPSFGRGGSLLTTFDASGLEPGSTPFRTAALVIQSDEKVVAVGSIGGHQGAFALARFLPTGDLDATFGVGGRVITPRTDNAQAYAAALQTDGKIVVGGGLGAGNDSVAFAAARYGPDGDLDPGFGSGGFVATSFAGGGSGIHAVSVTSDGKVVAAGSGYASAVPPQTAAGPQAAVNGGFAVVRYLPNGTPDASFGRGGVVLTTVGDAGSMPAGLGVQADGKLVAVGLTYFLVPPPTDAGGVSVTLLAALALVALAILATAVSIWRRQRGGARSPGSRTGPAPGASRSRRSGA